MGLLVAVVLQQLEIRGKQRSETDSENRSPNADPDSPSAAAVAKLGQKTMTGSIGRGSALLRSRVASVLIHPLTRRASTASSTSSAEKNVYRVEESERGAPQRRPSNGLADVDVNQVREKVLKEMQQISFDRPKEPVEKGKNTKSQLCHVGPKDASNVEHQAVSHEEIFSDNVRGLVGGLKR